MFGAYTPIVLLHVLLVTLTFQCYLGSRLDMYSSWYCYLGNS